MTTKTKKTSDKKALDDIAELLRTPYWDDLLPYVAELVRATGRDFTTVEVDPWTPDEDGNIVCVDCEEAYEKKNIIGDAQWSEPRCSDCFDSHKYGR